MSNVPLIASAMAALVLISAATFLCSLRRRRSPSQRSVDALGRVDDVELGGGGRGIDEAVLAAYPTLVFASSAPPQQPHGNKEEEKESQLGQEQQLEEEEAEAKKAASVQQQVPAGDTAARCAVCQADYAVGDELRLLPDCQHAFHRRCVDQWLRRRPTCPVCRASPPPPPRTGG